MILHGPISSLAPLPHHHHLIFSVSVSTLSFPGWTFFFFDQLCNLIFISHVMAVMIRYAPMGGGRGGDGLKELHEAMWLFRIAMCWPILTFRFGAITLEGDTPNNFSLVWTCPRQWRKWCSRWLTHRNTANFFFFGSRTRLPNSPVARNHIYSDTYDVQPHQWNVCPDGSKALATFCPPIPRIFLFTCSYFMCTKRAVFKGYWNNTPFLATCTYTAYLNTSSAHFPPSPTSPPLPPPKNNNKNYELIKLVLRFKVDTSMT